MGGGINSAFDFGPSLLLNSKAFDFSSAYLSADKIGTLLGYLQQSNGKM